MVIGEVLERTTAESAWQLCADKLADWVRTCWQEHTALGIDQWERTAGEDPAAFAGLRAEGFQSLVGLDYILKWWGAADADALAGEIDVIWKVMQDADNSSVTCYRTWIKLADRDFILGLQKGESAKRDANRLAFRHAFSQWLTLFRQL
jgi:hypothetical protein